MSRRESDDFLGEVITEEDEGSFRDGEVTLKVHSQDVQTWAGRFTEHLGLGAKLAKDVMLAAWLHDVGKADRRFQLLLVGGDEVSAALLPEPLAKSKMAADDRKARKDAQKRSGYPIGYRHEVLSLAMVEGNAALRKQAHDFDLVLHLVASHHGWCRPHAPPVEEGEAQEVMLLHGKDQLAANTHHGKARLGSGVAQRYTELVRRYGWWGLAWLEAIVRLADHRASEQREPEEQR
jgi:CRISPR-associated endonuclease/helicase Cas3